VHRHQAQAPNCKHHQIANSNLSLPLPLPLPYMLPLPYCRCRHHFISTTFIEPPPVVSGAASHCQSLSVAHFVVK
jgi:hypothetical protein